MKKTRIISLACILGSLILLAGCQKGLGLGNHGGQPVRFGAKTSTSPMSKAAYSGVGTFSGGFLTWERIDWESDDTVRIASNYAYLMDAGDSGIPMGVHFADYSLTGINTPEANPKESRATLAPLASNTNGLVWKDGQESGYSFYAVYPSPFKHDNIWLGSNDAALLESEDSDREVLGKVTATIPAEQTLASTSKPRYVSSTGAVASYNETSEKWELFSEHQEGGYTYNVYAPDKDIMFLTAAGKKSYASGEEVELEFKPAFTTFEFHITSNDATPNVADELTLTSFGLTATGANDVLSGTYTLMAGTQEGTIVAAEDEEALAASKSVSMSFGTSGLTINETTGIAFSLLTVPVANEGIIKAVLTTSDGSRATLPLTYSGKTSGHNEGDPYIFSPGKKYRVNLMKVGGGWSIKVILDLEDDDLPWTYVETDDQMSQDYPEASQFTIDGAANVREKYDPDHRNDGTWKKYRQYWDVTAGTPVTIDYKVMSPVGGTWKVELAGPGADADAFTLTGANGLSGTVDAEGDNVTPVKLTLTPSASASGIQVVYLLTTVTSADGTVTYSLDSETQLYDLRGYHYFVLNATQADYENGNVNVN